MPRIASQLKKNLGLLAISGLTATLIACGGGGGSSDDDSASDTDTDSSSRDYAGAGSRWDISLDDSDSSFVITRAANASAAVDLTVNGTYESLDSGFLRLTVSSATGTDAPSAGDQAFGLEVEGYAFILKPLDGDQVIPMINAGECPTSDIDANWVMVKKESDINDEAGADSSTRDFFGSFNYAVATDTPSLPSKFALTYDPVTNGGISGTGTCEDGLMLIEGAEMYLTANGGAIVHTGIDTPGDSSIIFALPQKPMTNISGVSGDYAGLLFDGSEANANDRIQPVAVTCDATGTCSGQILADVVTNTPSTDPAVPITLSGVVDALETGFVTGQIGGTSNIACMLDGDVLGTGKKVMSCVGQSPGNTSDMFNVLLVSR